MQLDTGLASVYLDQPADAALLVEGQRLQRPDDAAIEDENPGQSPGPNICPHVI